MPSFAKIHTARLRLTAIAIADLAEVHALHSDPELYRHAPEAMHPDLAHSASVIDGLLEDWRVHGLGYWTVRLPCGEFAGCAGVRRNEVNWNVYYRLMVTAWGNGYAEEVIRAAAPCVEAIEPGAVLQAVMRPHNPASEAVAKKLGMIFCGDQPDHDGVEQFIYQLPAALITTYR